MATMNLPDGIELQLQDDGRGPAVLLLHGGAGPAMMQPLAAALAPQARVLLPTHPGFAGTPCPDWLDRVDDLAFVYADPMPQIERPERVLELLLGL